MRQKKIDLINSRVLIPVLFAFGVGTGGVLHRMRLIASSSTTVFVRLVPEANRVDCWN